MKNSLIKSKFINEHTNLYKKDWENTIVYIICKNIFRYKKNPSYKWLCNHKYLLEEKYK